MRGNRTQAGQPILQALLNNGNRASLVAALCPPVHVHIQPIPPTHQIKQVSQKPKKVTKSVPSIQPSGMSVSLR